MLPLTAAPQDTPPQGDFFTSFAFSVAFSRAGEEANRWPANPRQSTTSGLECSRGQQRTEREKRGKSVPGMATSGGVCSRGQGPKPRQHWGNGQKKTQPIRVGFLSIGGAGGNRTRVRKPSTGSSTYLVRCFQALSSITPAEQAGSRRAALDLAPAQATRTSTISCELTHCRVAPTQSMNRLV